MFAAIGPHDTVADLSGVRKAAILLLALDNEASGMMLKSLPPQAVEEVTRELASIGVVPKKLRDAVVEEFYNLAVAQSWAVEGGLDNARMLLSKSLSKDEADAIMQPVPFIEGALFNPITILTGLVFVVRDF
ncbi:MAG: hypothetical protein AAGL98_03535, partial [Planctomycetota bacterium]